MSIDTHGQIKGFVKPEDIFDFIKQKWDKDAVNKIGKIVYCPLSEYNEEYEINEHSEDNEVWYSLCGFIHFKYKENNRSLFYCYNNLNVFENLEYYSKQGLEDMVRVETTFLSLGYYGDSVEIIRELITKFGGGWIDENDCDDKGYCLVGNGHMKYTLIRNSDEIVRESNNKRKLIKVANSMTKRATVIDNRVDGIVYENKVQRAENNK